MPSLPSSLPIGAVPRVSPALAASVPVSVQAPPAPSVPIDVSYEPLWAAAWRHTRTLFHRFFGREDDHDHDHAHEEPTGGSGGNVTVQPGDSLSRLAQRHLGNADRWREIFEANRDTISNPNLIHPGQVLRLPGAAPAPAPAPPPPGSGSYTVQRGDTLSKIAQRTLGSAGRWPEIFEANKDKIQNPNIVWPGLSLRIPGGPPAPGPAPAPSAPSGKWAWPVQGRTTSNYGMRKHPISGEHKMHTGLDIGAASGSPVKTPLPGRVTFAGWNGGYGNYVVVDHGNGLQTAYAHLSAINVGKGQQIGAGTQIGKVGSTGNSTGPHLHFEVKRNGQFVDPRGLLA